MKMRNYKYTLLLGITCFFLVLAQSASARYSVDKNVPKPIRSQMKVAAGCDPPTSQTDLDINNVRARLLNGGDMWWDLFATRDARYEIPKVAPGQRSIHSSFASGLWFGGIDDGNQLRTAGQTYRQTGIDFWAGPLDTTTAEIAAEDCNYWDRQYSVLQSDIIKFQAGEPASKSILDWPGNGRTERGEAQFMAPFVDVDQDGSYNPTNGDYPTLSPDEIGAKPDQMVWWVYNDKGGTHTAYPGGEPIGLEIHALAFAFSTSNEINNMTFYKYKVFNRASTRLNDTYFGVFTDSDLGGPDDDFVGCNMALVDSDGSGPMNPKPRSFGFTYNSDNDDQDGASPGYGATPPAFGIDYFRGPLDENGDEIPMTTFMFFTNSAQPNINSDPRDAIQLYRYLRGFWADGQPLVYGQPTGRGAGTPTQYAFPGNTDPNGGAPWFETAETGDRRMVQSSGPFVLAPGAVNEVIIGAVWARASSGDNLSSIASALIADDKAQVLFDNQFRLANGPNPSNLVGTPSHNKIILTIERSDLTEKFELNELDNEDLLAHNYKFQGFRIFQLKDGTVSASEINDGSKAIEIIQVDIKDSIGKIINKAYDPEVQHINAKVMVEGSNTGIKHFFEITTDAFAGAANARIVDGKTYYFLLIPYAYSSDASFTKYLPSRTSTAVTAVTAGRQVVNGLINGTFDEYLQVTRVDGGGNGGNVLDITPETEASIVASGGGVPMTFLPGRAPIVVRTYDPNKLQKRSYGLKFNSGFTSYTMYDAASGDTLMMSDTTYSQVNTLTENEQIAEERIFELNGFGVFRLVRATSLGFYVKANNVIFPTGTPGARDNNNNFLEASIVYANPSKAWLGAISGNRQNTSPAVPGWIELNSTLDTTGVYDDVLGGNWAPYKFLRTNPSDLISRTSPLLDGASKNPANSKLDSLGSYDIVFTSDTTKWSDCVVLEAGIPNVTFGEPTTVGTPPGKRFNLRKSDIGYGVGRGKFPGYAINLETGERVNIFFAEASSYPEENGADMLWNPTSNRDFFKRGGRHFTYVTRRKYDGCNEIYTMLNGVSGDINNPPNTVKRQVFSMVDWVTVPILNDGQELVTGSNTNTTKVRLRVAKPYINKVATGLNGGAPMFTFDDINAIKGATDDAEKNKKLAMDLINVVPNPYYAYSSYEPDRNDYRVRFTNLPAITNISIYTSNGVLVRRYRKSDPAQTYIEWDLRNSNSIPIASGVYIVHVDCPGVGQKSLKWMGVMRPIDFNNF